MSCEKRIPAARCLHPGSNSTVRRSFCLRSVCGHGPRAWFECAAYTPFQSDAVLPVVAVRMELLTQFPTTLHVLFAYYALWVP